MTEQAPKPPPSLRPDQIAMVDAIGKAFTSGKKRVLAQMPTGCHRKGQQIVLPNGRTRNVEDVKEGDQLVGDDGSLRTVLHLCQGTGRMLEIIPAEGKGKPFVVNEDHLLTLGYRGEVIDVTVKKFILWPEKRKKEWKLIRSGPVEFIGGDSIELPIEPYFLGLLIGDGCLQGTPTIYKPDPEIEQECRRQANILGMTVALRGEGTSIGWAITTGIIGSSGNLLISILKDLGLRSTKAEEKFVPAMYKFRSVTQRLEMIAGLLDSDGHMSKGGFDWISKSRQLAEDLCFLARSVGLTARIVECQKKAQTGEPGAYWRVYVGGNCSIIPTKLPRKQAQSRTQRKNFRYLSFDIKQVSESENYYGFKLDGNGRYLIDDFIITHNSGKTYISSVLLRRSVKKKKKGIFVVHLDAIIEDTIDRFSSDGFRVGRIQSGYPYDPDAEVYVGSIMTMLSQDLWPPMDLVIYDECFPAGTMIDGMPIQDHIVGMLVRSYNHETMKIEHKPVKRVFISKAKSLIRVYLADGTSIVSTPNHPYYVGNYDYATGEILQDRYVYKLSEHDRHEITYEYTFKKVRVLRVEEIASNELVYNLEVEDNHNYFVNDTLVHNCHHASAEGASTLFTKYENTYILGLSATPETSTGRGLDHLFDILIQGPQPKTLIDAGVLVKPVVYCPWTQGKALARDPVDALTEFAPGRQSVVFAKNGNHAREIQSRLGNSRLYLDDTKVIERKAIMADLRNGSLQHVVTVRAILEGADVKPISAVVTCTKFASAGGWLQAVGRGLRADKGKIDCIVIDLMGAALQWGLPDEERIWTLEGKASHRVGTVPEPLQRCKECYAIFEKTKICPKCGARNDMIEHPDQTRIIRRDMHLLLPPEAKKAKAVIYINNLKKILMLRGIKPNSSDRMAWDKAPQWVRDALDDGT